MNTILAFLYAPLIFFALKTFDIKTVSMIILGASFIWTLFCLKNGIKSALFPLLYFCVGLLTFLLESFMVLKILPLLITALITGTFCISYLKKESIILTFAKRFSKQEFDAEQKEYIQKSTLFWVIISLVNLGLHVYAYLGENINFWVFYSSIGGYLILILAGLAQFLHKQFIFEKRRSTL